eukprot:scaffold67542_cov63-Phaeocystis_antarctica.AAC.10
MPVAVRHCPSFGWLLACVLPLVRLLLVCLPLIDGAWSMSTKVNSKAGSVTFWPCSSRTHTVRSTDSSACLGAATLIRPNWSRSPFRPCSDIPYVEPASASTLSETRSRSRFPRYRPMASSSRTGGSFAAAPSRLFETTTASSKLSLAYSSMRRQGTGAAFWLRPSNELVSSCSPLVEPTERSAVAAVVATAPSQLGVYTTTTTISGHATQSLSLSSNTWRRLVECPRLQRRAPSVATRTPPRVHTGVRLPRPAAIDRCERKGPGPDERACLSTRQLGSDMQPPAALLGKQDAATHVAAPNRGGAVFAVPTRWPLLGWAGAITRDERLPRDDRARIGRAVRACWAISGYRSPAAVPGLQWGWCPLPPPSAPRHRSRGAPQPLAEPHSSRVVASALRMCGEGHSGQCGARLVGSSGLG